MLCFSASCYIITSICLYLHAMSDVLTNKCCLDLILHLDFLHCAFIFQVMRICALPLWCLAGKIQGAGGEPCRLMVKSVPGSVDQAGDVVIGGLFPVHVKAPQPELEFYSETVNASCEM